MRHIDPVKTGVAVGAVLGLWHLMWVTLVAIGWAKPVLDFVLQLHFIKLNYALEPYSAVTAGELVLLTSMIGGLVGFIFALIWNRLVIGGAPAWAKDSSPVPSPQLGD